MSEHQEKARESLFPFRRLRESWAQTWKLGRHWRLEIEWIPAARSFDFWIFDERMRDA